MWLRERGARRVARSFSTGSTVPYTVALLSEIGGACGLALMRRVVSQASRRISPMDNADGTDAIRSLAFTLLRILDDTTQHDDLREFAFEALTWALHRLNDEDFLSDVLRVLRRAVDRDDDVPLLLLHFLDAPLQDPRFVAGLERIGDRARATGRVDALARLTGVFLRDRSRPAPRAPVRWVRSLIQSAATGEVDIRALCTVARWIQVTGSDIDGVIDLIPDVDGWLEKYDSRGGYYVFRGEATALPSLVIQPASRPPEVENVVTAREPSLVEPSSPKPSKGLAVGPNDRTAT
jgi:hypothetical protein